MHMCTSMYTHSFMHSHVCTHLQKCRHAHTHAETCRPMDMHTLLHTCTCTHAQMHTHARMCTRMLIHIHLHANTYTCTAADTHKHRHKYTCTHTLHKFMPINMHKHTHVHTHTHAHPHADVHTCSSPTYDGQQCIPGQNRNPQDFASLEPPAHPSLCSFTFSPWPAAIRLQIWECISENAGWVEDGQFCFPEMLLRYYLTTL